jgi:dTDP-4-amino-4,6-dideoxygalactose transaminase
MRHISKVLRSAQLSSGKVTREFEARFADYVGTRYAIAVSNGTEALHLGLLAAGVEHGSEVILPSFTYHAAANAILYCDAMPVLVDVTPETMCIDVNQVAESITPKTRAIIVTHIAGHPCNMKPLLDLAEKSNLVLIEDAAHAMGATYEDRPVGSLGHIGCFSFYPTKPLTTGEGGIITTNESDVEQKLRLLRSLCTKRFERIHYDVQSIGYTSRMSEIQAALGLDQLRTLDKTNSIIINKANILKSYLNDMNGIVLPHEEPYAKHVYNLFIVKIIQEKFGVTRDKVSDFLHEKGINTQLHYIPLHRLTYSAQNFRFSKNSLKVSDYLWKTVLSLPLYPSITNRQLSKISRALHVCSSKSLSKS